MTWGLAALQLISYVKTQRTSLHSISNSPTLPDLKGVGWGHLFHYGFAEKCGKFNLHIFQSPSHSWIHFLELIYLKLIVVQFAGHSISISIFTNLFIISQGWWTFLVPRKGNTKTCLTFSNIICFNYWLIGSFTLVCYVTLIYLAIISLYILSVLFIL